MRKEEGSIDHCRVLYVNKGACQHRVLKTERLVEGRCGWDGE
jgi:hypothetical protein